MPRADRATLEREINEYEKLLENRIQESEKYKTHLDEMHQKMDEKPTQVLSKLTEYYIKKDQKQGPRYSMILERRSKKWEELKTSFISRHSPEESNRELIKLHNEYLRSHANLANKAEDLYRIGIGLTEEINDLLEELCPGRGYKFKLLRGKYSGLEHQLISTKEDFLGGRSVYLQFDSNSDQGYSFLLVVSACRGGARCSWQNFDNLRDLLKALKVPGYADEPTTNALESVEGAQNLSETRSL